MYTVETDNIPVDITIEGTCTVKHLIHICEEVSQEPISFRVDRECKHMSPPRYSSCYVPGGIGFSLVIEPKIHRSLEVGVGKGLRYEGIVRWIIH